MSETPDTPRDLLLSFAAERGLSLDERALTALPLFVREVLAWNAQYNLVGVKSEDRAVKDLLLDSLLPGAFLPLGASLLDAGSGAGFPAIPLKISRPDLAMDLMEATAKKVTFLRHTIRLMGLQGIRVLHGRVEKDKHLLVRRGYDAVTSRAMAPLPVTLAWCGPHLREGGVLFAFQGKVTEDLLASCEKALSKGGLSLAQRIPYLLPGRQEERELLVFSKRPWRGAAPSQGMTNSLDPHFKKGESREEE